MDRATKSRNGCVKCKQRKVKCDERKPTCLRCRKRGIPCEYRTTWKWHNRQVDQQTLGFPSVTVDDLCLEDHVAQELQPDSISAPGGNLFASTVFPEPSSTLDFQVAPSPLWPEIPDSLWPSEISGDAQLSFEYDGLSEPYLKTIAETTSQPSQPGLLPNSLTPQPQMDEIHQFSVGDSLCCAQDSPHRVEDGDDNDLRASLAYIPTRVLSDSTTSLTTYYFNNVAPLFCCCPEIQNPFSVQVAVFWNSSNCASLPYVMQSMSFACLGELTPRLQSDAWRLRSQAKQLLSEETNSISRTLSSILLGASSGWFRPKDSMVRLYEQFVLSTRRSLAPASVKDAGQTWTHVFLQGVMVYWGMFLLFMISSSLPSLNFTTPSDRAQSPPFSDAGDLFHIVFDDMPHPWTGVSTDVMVLLTKVIRLIRCQVLHNMGPVTDDDSQSSQRAVARILEEQLVSICEAPSNDSLSHKLLRLRELYLVTAFMQLYRVFPQLLSDRLGQRTRTHLGLRIFQQSSVGSNLFHMADHLLGLLTETKLESFETRFHLIPLVACCTELRTPRENKGHEDGSATFGSLTLETIKVAQARQSARDRLIAMRRVFPGNRISTLVELITNMWARLDSDFDADRLHWVQILMDRGYNFI